MLWNVSNTKGAAMLPTVVIGADDSVRQAFQDWEAREPHADVLFYESVEAATFGLDDLARTSGEQVPLAEQDLETGRWRVTVVYGPLAYGPIATAQAGAQLAHDGWTVVAGTNLKDDQTTPYRVRDGQPEGQPSNTMVWEVMAKVSANFVVDVALASGDASLEGLRRLLEARPRP
jgi:hypothetical protein